MSGSLDELGKFVILDKSPARFLSKRYEEPRMPHNI